MEDLLFHPKVVHLPVALAVLMPLVAGGLLLAWWRDWLPRRAWAIAVVLQGLLVASGVMAMRTGEAQEDRVEQVVAEQHIETHEEAAEVFVWASVAVFVLALGAGLVRKERAALVVALAASLGTVAILGLGYRVGQSGGALVYEHGAANAYLGDAPRASPPISEDDDSDD